MGKADGLQPVGIFGLEVSRKR